MAFIHSPKIITDGLVLALDAANSKSYVSGSTNWFNLTNPSISGSLIGEPTFSTGSGGSILFDGVNDYCSLGSSASSLIQGKTNFTICVWFNMVNTAVLRGLIGTLNYNCGKNLGLVASNTDLQFYNDYGSTCYAVGLNTFIETNKWIYAVGTYNGTTTSLYSFKNNTLYTATGTDKSGSTNTFASTFQVFGDEYGPYYTNTYGSIASVYDRTLSLSEIQQNYNTTRGRFGL